MSWLDSPYNLILQQSRQTYNLMCWSCSIDILRANGNKLSSCKSFTWSRSKIPWSAINASVSVWSFYFNMGNPTACLWLCFICFELCRYYSVIISKLPLSPNHLELSPSLSPPIPKTFEKDLEGGGAHVKGKMIVCLTIQSQKISLKSSLISIILRLHCSEFLIIYYSHQSVAMWLTYCFLIILVAFDTINHDILLILLHSSFSFGP